MMGQPFRRLFAVAWRSIAARKWWRASRRAADVLARAGARPLLEGAPLPPREPAAARALLSVCCCARRRTVLAMTFEFGHGLGCSRGLELTIVTGMWGSWRAGFAVRSAGATRVRCV